MEEILKGFSASELKDLAELKNNPGYKSLLKVRKHMQEYMANLSLNTAAYNTDYLFTVAERRGTLMGWEADAGVIRQAEDKLKEQKAGSKKIAGGVSVEDMLRYKNIDS